MHTFGPRNELTAEEKSHLKFLRNEEHKYQSASQKTNFEHPNINQDWDRARNELKEYVSELRRKGRHI